MPIKAILFDIDGTLIDSNNMHVLAWEEAFATVGARFERSDIHDQFGKGADMLIPTLLPGLDETKQQRLAEVEGDVFKRKFLSQAKPFPGARNLILHVHEQGQRLVLATSSSQDQLDYYLDLLDVRDLVTATTTGDDVENTKPAPDIFAAALAKLSGVEAPDALVVGDTPYDIQAAKACGIGTIALRSGGFPDDALHDAGALCIYDDVAAILRDYGQSPLAK